MTEKLYDKEDRRVEFQTKDDERVEHRGSPSQILNDIEIRGAGGASVTWATVRRHRRRSEKFSAQQQQRGSGGQPRGTHRRCSSTKDGVLAPSTERERPHGSIQWKGHMGEFEGLQGPSTRLRGGIFARDLTDGGFE